MLEQYRISDFLEWHSQKRLILNPDFQRGSVWQPAARSFLIDTILRELPMPKIYLRSRIDIESRNTIREVVDGQQRLRTIIDFRNNKFSLTKRAGEYQGLRFSDLDDELKYKFLSYPISVDQLLNASDDDVLEVFSRLNSYNVKLNPAEKRHAQFHGEFKFAVREHSRKWHLLWEEAAVFTPKQRVRMQDDSLTAEIFCLALEGLKDGGESKINSLYRKYDDGIPNFEEISNRLDGIAEFISINIAEQIKDTPISKPPNLLILFAALYHSMYGLPDTEHELTLLPPNKDLLPTYQLNDNLIYLGTVLSSDAPPPSLTEFYNNAKSSTHRIKSRKSRFWTLYSSITQ